jgi:hypothetical protein
MSTSMARKPKGGLQYSWDIAALSLDLEMRDKSEGSVTCYIRAFQGCDLVSSVLATQVGYHLPSAVVGTLRLGLPVSDQPTCHVTPCRAARRNPRHCW